MRIKHVKIQNYRNLKNISVDLESVVTIIGENNSGKSNFLKAITLPFLPEDGGSQGKNLQFSDINEVAKTAYYDFIRRNIEGITNGSITDDIIINMAPQVIVEVSFYADDLLKYYVKEFASSADENGDIVFSLAYKYHVTQGVKFVERVKSVVINELSKAPANGINSVKMNLLPVELYGYSIYVPQKESHVSYDTLKAFRYSALVAERDSFSSNNDRIGSKALLNLLQMKMSPADQLAVEKEYTHFFDILKNLSGMENILNWQQESDIPNAKEFFENISVLPNMPSMSSLLNSVRLGYSGDSMSMQGLGQRNLILLLVMLNSLLESKEGRALSIITVEEPEAHLCINNIHLLSSFFDAFSKGNKTTQLFYSTHSQEFINKADMKQIIVMANGNAYALSQELDDSGRNYLSKNVNMDLFKLLLSRRCILVEGLTEELLIKSYIRTQAKLSDVEVISFHKGYKEIMDIWLKINGNSNHRLGCVRDYDNQENAKKEHEKYNQHANICVQTTKGYTLEVDLVNTGDNFTLLQKLYGEELGWNNKTKEEVSDSWRGMKSDMMLQVCQDLLLGNLTGFQMPDHIQTILDFMERE